MTTDHETKALFIKAYYKDLERRIEFLEALEADGHDKEALLLCCCYIEALGNQLYNDYDNKFKNYCTVLDEHGGNTFFGLVHPKQVVRVLDSNKLFQKNLAEIEILVATIGEQLCEKNELKKILSPIVTSEQIKWLNEFVFKLTIAAISYRYIRYLLVHDISALPVGFSITIFDGKLAPTIDFQLMYPALQNIFKKSKEVSIKANKWPHEM